MTTQLDQRVQELMPLHKEQLARIIARIEQLAHVKHDEILRDEGAPLEGDTDGPDPEPDPAAGEAQQQQQTSTVEASTGAPAAVVGGQLADEASIDGASQSPDGAGAEEPSKKVDEPGEGAPAGEEQPQ